MAGKLAGKVALITGGTSGIGEATAELFVKEGASVAITGRSREKGQAIADRLGNACIMIEGDVMQEADIKAAIDKTMETFGGLDILFNNAGGPTGGDLENITPEAIHYGVDLLFSSVVLGMKHAIPKLKEKGGVIINNSSVAAIRAGQGEYLYSAVKAAVTHYSRLAGTELGQYNIRVNCISPGSIATPIFWGGSARANTLSADDNAKKMEKLQRNLINATPLTRPGLANDIAEAALFLASDAGSFVNCHDLVVDGGRTSMFFEPPRT